LDIKQYEQAFADLPKAIELAPVLPHAYASRAELLLESDDPQFKRPDEALKDAQRACEPTQWQASYYLALLASAYAAVNDYTSPKQARVR
jgi:tetratricopeptide (TPR) repeat protein